MSMTPMVISIPMKTRERKRPPRKPIFSLRKMRARMVQNMGPV